MNQKDPATSRHLGRLATGSLLLALLLLAGFLWLLGAPATGRQPSPAQVITRWTPVTLQDAPRAAATPSVAPAPIYDPELRPRASLGRPNSVLPSPELVVVEKAPEPAPAPMTTSRQLTGLASWYCRAGVSICHYQYPDTQGFDAYAAAGPGLRKAMCGSAKSECWRGRAVLVNGVRVELRDWCQCYRGEAHEKIIDLYYDVFARVGSAVAVRW